MNLANKTMKQLQKMFNKAMLDGDRETMQVVMDEMNKRLK